MESHMVSRRAILAGAAGIALGVAGCSSSDDTSGGSGPTSGGGDTSQPSATGGATGSATASSTGTGGGSATATGGAGGNSVMPAYAPFPGGKADLPALDTGVLAGYFSYPENPQTFAKAPIGTGSDDKISVMSFTFGSSPGRDKSAWWQNLEKTLGVQIDLKLSPYGDYNAKLNTTIAGGDLPDIVMTDTSRIPLPALKQLFADLGPYLSGDKVKDYPGLAWFPSLDWRLPIIDGILFGIQQPINQASFGLGVRQDLLDQRGIKFEISNGDDMLALYKELARPKDNTWGFGQDLSWMLWLVMEMHGIPNYTNGWSQENGKFTNQWEYPEMKDCLSIVQKMWKDDLFNPDSANPQVPTWFLGGKSTTYSADITNWSGFQLAQPDIKIQLIPLPKWDGGGLAVKQLDDGAGNFAVFKKADPDRMQKILRFTEYLAAPFGTQEFLTVNYGEEGVSYTMKDGNPVRTGAGQADAYNISSLTYVATAANAVLYTPGHEDLVKTEYNYLKTVMEHTNVSAALGLYSETHTAPQASIATKAVHEARDDILYGRKPVSIWDSAVKSWKSSVGDKMRKEYEEAFAKQNG
jgi:putative aldouronate transport system substrate-binding protein